MHRREIAEVSIGGGVQAEAHRVNRGLAEGLDDEVLCWTILGTQRDQIVEIAERHACSLLAAETPREVGECLHGAGGVDPAFSTLIEDLNKRLIDDVRDLIHEKRDTPIAPDVVADSGKCREIGEE